MQRVLLFLASLVIPMVRDDTLHICHVALLSGARVYEVAGKCLSSLSYEPPPQPPPHSCPVPLSQGSLLYLCSVAREFRDSV